MSDIEFVPSHPNAAGEVPASGPIVEVRAALTRWAQYEVAESTVRRLGGLAERFGHRLEAAGVTSVRDATLEDCEAFVWAPTKRNGPPSLHTVHLRRTALRGLYRSLREIDPSIGDPSRDLELPARPSDALRPLTTLEIELLRTAALGRGRTALRSAVVVALAESGATTGEIPSVTWTHVDLLAAVVALSGADPVQARDGHLTTWGVGVLRRCQRETRPGPDDPVVTRRATKGEPHTRQAAIVNLLRRLLVDAGLSDPTVRPGSVRLWAATEHLNSGGIEAAARALGVDSLDVAAAALGYDWRTSS